MATLARMIRKGFLAARTPDTLSRFYCRGDAYRGIAVGTRERFRSHLIPFALHTQSFTVGPLAERDLGEGPARQAGPTCGPASPGGYSSIVGRASSPVQGRRKCERKVRKLSEALESQRFGGSGV